MLGLERRRGCQIAHGVDQHERHARVTRHLDHAPQVVCEVRDDAAPPGLVVMIFFQPAAIIEQRFDFGGQDGPAGWRLGRRLVLSAQKRFPRQVECAPMRCGSQRRVDQLATAGNVVEGARFEEFVVARAKDDQVGLIVEHFGEHRHQPIAGVGNAAAVDHFPLARWIGRGQCDFEPGGERRFDAERPASDRGSPQHEHAVLAGRLGGRE